MFSYDSLYQLGIVETGLQCVPWNGQSLSCLIQLIHFFLDPLFSDLYLFVSTKDFFLVILYYKNALYTQRHPSSKKYTSTFFQSLDFLAFFLALAGLSSLSVFRFFSFLFSTATLDAGAAAGAASRSTCSTSITSPLNFLLVFSGPGVLNPYV